MDFQRNIEFQLCKSGNGLYFTEIQAKRIRKYDRNSDQQIRGDNDRFVYETPQAAAERKRFSVYDNDSLEWLSKNYIW